MTHGRSDDISISFINTRGCCSQTPTTTTLTETQYRFFMLARRDCRCRCVHLPCSGSAVHALPQRVFQFKQLKWSAYIMSFITNSNNELMGYGTFTIYISTITSKLILRLKSSFHLFSSPKLAGETCNHRYYHLLLFFAMLHYFYAKAAPSTQLALNLFQFNFLQDSLWKRNYTRSKDVLFAEFLMFSCRFHALRSIHG